MIKHALFSLAICASCIHAYGDVETLNLAQAFDPLKAILAAGGQGNIVVLGDSISYRDGSYLPVFTSLLQNAYGNGGPGYASIATGGGLAGVYSGSYDYGVVDGDNAPYNSLDGFWTNLTSAGFGFIQPTSNTVTLQYAAQPGGGTVVLYQQATGSQVHIPVATISTNSPTDQVKTFTFTPVTDNDTLYFNPQGDGPVLMLGMTSVTPPTGIKVDRIANGGWTTQDFLQRNWTFDQQLPLLTPDVVMIWLGQNDQNYFTPDQFAANLNALIDRVQTDTPNSHIVLISSYATSPALAAFSQAEEQIAQNRDLGYIDFYDVPLEPNDLIDGIHLSQTGGDRFGQLLFDAFQSDGANIIWNGNADGTTWDKTLANWSSLGSAATFSDSTAVTFDDTAPGGNTLINLPAAVSPSSITVNSSANNFTITGAGSITTDDITKSGTSTFTLHVPTMIGGPTAINAGTIVFAAVGNSAASISGGGNLTIASGGTLISDGITIGGVWTINGTHTIRANDGNIGTSLVNNLVISQSGSAYTGTLDLTTNALIVEATPANKTITVATLAGQISSGKNGGAWTGTGITSSSVATNANTTLALVDNAELGATTFNGQSVDSNSIIITQAVLGDANLTGIVDFGDLLKVAQNFGEPGGWAAGNMEGPDNGGTSLTVDFGDLLLVAQHFGQSLPILPSSPALATAPVPEPASLTLLTLGATGMLMRRRRSA